MIELRSLIARGKISNALRILVANYSYTKTFTLHDSIGLLQACCDIQAMNGKSTNKVADEDLDVDRESHRPEPRDACTPLGNIFLNATRGTNRSIQRVQNLRTIGPRAKPVVM